MTDTTAAPEDRYVVYSYHDGLSARERYVVFDRAVVGSHCATKILGTWAAAYCEAQRLNRESRAANKPTAAASCCDCAAKLREAKEEAERYRHALAQIWRHCSGPALRYAAGALFADARAKGENNAV